MKLQLTDEELARFAARRYRVSGCRHPAASDALLSARREQRARDRLRRRISEEDEKALDLNEYAGTSLIGKTGIEQCLRDASCTGTRVSSSCSSMRRAAPSSASGKGPVRLDRRRAACG